jgi:hypothetical protein
VGIHCQLLLITERQSLLYIAFSATLFLYLQQVFSATWINCNYSHQFTWHLHSIAVTMGQIVTAWFIHVNTAHTVRTIKKYL